MESKIKEQRIVILSALFPLKLSIFVFPCTEWRRKSDTPEKNVTFIRVTRKCSANNSLGEFGILRRDSQ